MSAGGGVPRSQRREPLPGRLEPRPAITIRLRGGNPWRLLPTTLEPVSRRAAADLMSLVCRALAVGVVVCQLLLGQVSRPPFQGQWVATAGGLQSFRGKWSARALPGTPNGVQGSWTLLDEGGRVLATGTWTARKIGTVWRGAWSARSDRGGALTGTWEATQPRGSGKAFQDLFQLTLEKQVSGAWATRRKSGQWWLKGAPWPSSPR